MNDSFPKTQDLTQSVLRQMEVLIDRKDAYNVQILQDGYTFRRSRIMLLNDPAAKLIRMRVHEFADSTLRAGVSKPDPSNNWTTKLEDVRNETRIRWKMTLATREMQLMWHVQPGA